MADTTKEVREVGRDAWTLADLRDLVSDLDDWDGDSTVALTSPSFRSTKGVIEVFKDA